MSERLDQLTCQTQDLDRRSRELPAALEAAQAQLVEALSVGADAGVVEAFRVQCTSLYEAKLDLVLEAAVVQRALMEEARRGP